MLPRSALAALLAAAAFASPALAQSDDGPRVDIVEVAGPVDAPIARYLRERIAGAADERLDLLVLSVDSLGILKASSNDDVLPDLAISIRDSAVPVAVHVGPRGAVAGGGVVAILQAAHVRAMSPSATLDVTDRFDLADAQPIADAELDALRELATRAGEAIDLDARRYTAVEAQAAGLVDAITPGVADLLVEIDGSTILVGDEPVVVRTPKDLTTVRFWQPGPLRRALHAMASPALAYLALMSAIALAVFEASQPGFGVAGGTAVLLGVVAVYAFTVLPAAWWAMALILAGSALLWLDVVRDELLAPTWIGLTAVAAGSIWLLPRHSEATALPLWVALATTFAVFVFFAPVMTLVRRQRQPIATSVKRALIGESGDVRSMLNPEGYVMVSGELWRARLAEGGRLRVGEPVKVTGVDGAVLLVAALEPSAN